MGNGKVKYPNYKSGGKCESKGVKNKRRQKIEKERRTKQREKERKESAAERSLMEWEQQFDSY